MNKSSVNICAVNGLDIPNSKWAEQVPHEILCRPDLGEASVIPNSTIIERFFERDSTLGRMGGIMLRRNYVGETRFRTDLHIGEDVVFIYENITKGSGAAILEEKGYYWRRHVDISSLDISVRGFLSRLYCKEVLWINEEKFNRITNANKEKRSLLVMYIRILRRKKLYCEESKRIRQEMKKYKSTIFPALSLKDKIIYCLSVYFPWFYLPSTKLFLKAKRIKAKMMRSKTLNIG